ncbi:hypothetical protein J6O86_02245 [bacterium]|nr:hypothetical protein [bacterium]
MIGPKVYAELSSVAKEFLARESKVEKQKFVPPYQYLGAGANLTAKVPDEVADIHKYLSPSALKKDVVEEFGNVESFAKALDIVG